MIRVAINTKCVETAQRKHSLQNEPDLVQVLGKMMTGVSLLASTLKGEERIKAFAVGSKGIKEVCAEAIQLGEVRGFVNYNMEEPKPRQLGEGIFQVSKILYNQSQPITSAVSIQKGDLSSEFEKYMEMSDQIPSVFDLDTSIDRNKVVFSGGLMLQSLPFAPNDLIPHLKQHIKELPSLSELMQGKTLLQVLEQVLPRSEYELLQRDKVEYLPLGWYCRHSRENIVGTLLNLSAEELKELDLESHPVTCHYCSEKMEFTKEEKERLNLKLYGFLQ